MPKGVNKKLEQEIKYILGFLIDVEPGQDRFPRPLLGTDFSESIEYLIDLAALEAVPAAFTEPFIPPRYQETVRVTAYGRDYYQRLTTFAPWYWFKRNWFPAIVAAATIAASVGGIVVNALD